MWGESLDRYHKHDPNTVTDSANGHGHEGCLRTALWACPARHRGHQGRIQALWGWVVVVWEESLDRYHKHDPHTVTDSASVTATEKNHGTTVNHKTSQKLHNMHDPHGHGLGHGHSPGPYRIVGTAPNI